MRVIPEHTASKREQRDTRAVIVVFGVIGVLACLFGFATGNVLGFGAGCFLLLITVWISIAHVFGPRA